jgi:hypothetical protein
MTTYSGDRALGKQFSLSEVGQTNSSSLEILRFSQNIYLNALNFSVISQKTQYTILKDQ